MKMKAKRKEYLVQDDETVKKESASMTLAAVAPTGGGFVGLICRLATAPPPGLVVDGTVTWGTDAATGVAAVGFVDDAAGIATETGTAAWGGGRGGGGSGGSAGGWFSSASNCSKNR
ncbi:hypothetical protein Ancab_038547 [Ancistrocladus abbreviatus]